MIHLNPFLSFWEEDHTNDYLLPTDEELQEFSLFKDSVDIATVRTTDDLSFSDELATYS